MSRSLSINHYLIILGIPLIIYSLMILLVASPLFDSGSDLLSLGITVDLLLMVPVIYYLLIRKTPIPGSTVIPVILLGLLIATFILPADNRQYLDLFLSWVLPFIELFVVIYIIRQARSLSAKINQHESADFYTGLVEVIAAKLPKVLVRPFATEIAAFYYGFIKWNKTPIGQNQFTYNKESSTNAILITLLFIVIAETFVLHLLISGWSSTAAWIITGLSIYTALQLFGLFKSIFYRPIEIKGDRLILRYGFANEVSLKLEDIESVEFSTSDLEAGNGVRKLSILGDLDSHNIVLTCKSPQELIGFYGMRYKFHTLAFHIDNKERFLKSLEPLLKS